jgi:hypothetical protein
MLLPSAWAWLPGTLPQGGLEREGAAAREDIRGRVRCLPGRASPHPLPEETAFRKGLGRLASRRSGRERSVTAAQHRAVHYVGKETRHP